ncbi:MAG: 6-carboxytetrahydropterin synthase [Phycisphaerales bacterium]|nr:MAG: 6-carboxytetrahydropterin synthase [Phycisphaerales bacterium]
MHVLGRHVRFSIDPFSPAESPGFNPYASKPTGEGLSIFLQLSVEVGGEIEPATGFVVNVTDIDETVRIYAVPLFAERISNDFRAGTHSGFSEIAELLGLAWDRLANRFGTAELRKLSLKLNPFREIAMDSEDLQMVYFSEKFEFAAMHKLWNDDFSEQRNFDVFGKCANPAGHGHNYIVEVTIRKQKGDKALSAGEFERIVDNELIQVVDHKNLNADVAEFLETNPTVENIATFAWERLADKFRPASLYRITVWESDRTYCSYYG